MSQRGVSKHLLTPFVRYDFQSYLRLTVRKCSAQKYGQKIQSCALIVWLNTNHNISTVIIWLTFQQRKFQLYYNNTKCCFIVWKCTVHTNAFKQSIFTIVYWIQQQRKTGKNHLKFMFFFLLTEIQIFFLARICWKCWYLCFHAVKFIFSDFPSVQQ